MYNKLIILFFLFATLISHAANENFPVGATQAGMAGCGLTRVDVFAVNHNPGALAYLKGPSLGLFAENRFVVPELNLQSGAFALPTKSGVFALNVTHFGYSLYNESKFGLAFAKSFGKRFAMGIQLAYLNTHFGEDYGNKGVPIAEIGFLSEPYDNLFIGVHVFNLTRSKIADYNDEKLPTIIRAGAGLKLSERLLINAEAEKDLTLKPTYRAGMEYLFMEQLYLRLGASANPNQISFGLGYKTKKLRADIAFSTHQVLGISPHVGFVYMFNNE